MIMHYLEPYSKRHPGKKAARVAVYRSVKNGLIKKLPCAECGEEKVHAHHINGYDGENRLNVKWLCIKHHREAHKKMNKEICKTTYSATNSLPLNKKVKDMELKPENTYSLYELIQMNIFQIVGKKVGLNGPAYQKFMFKQGVLGNKLEVTPTGGRNGQGGYLFKGSDIIKFLENLK